MFYNQLAQLGFRVIINASENDIPVFDTTRELFLHVEPMTRDTLNNIPEYAILMSRLEKAGLKDVVWAVVGGVPSRLNQVFFISLNHVCHIFCDSTCIHMFLLFSCLLPSRRLKSWIPTLILSLLLSRL